ncbi:MAG: TonB-dependent receptor domain-containing protein [Gemmatimonadaceae bacterium]
MTDVPSSNLRLGAERQRHLAPSLRGLAGARLKHGRLTLSPGLRGERVQRERENRLAQPAVRGRTQLSEWIPGLGATWQLARATSLFGGVHRGFSPPRPEDVIADADRGVVDIDAERSWNYEIGLRWLAIPGLRAEATAFWLDFSNQIVAQSLAGGTGAALTNGGRTKHGRDRVRRPRGRGCFAWLGA